ncbi:hypothetical protein [Actinoplanes philippinensis]|uniref:hypothetical protein n=1 Tax=Actinoplanes philippinensis TaxID=35752 RepID=UPI0033E6FB5E
MLPNNSRGPVSAAAVVAPIVLTADAVAALVMTFPLSLQMLVWATDDSVFHLVIALAAVALLCPAVAALVGGVRTWAAHLTGCIVTALLAVACAGLTAMTVRYEYPDWLTVTSSGLFAANTIAVFLLTGRLRPTIGEWPSSPRSPSV